MTAIPGISVTKDTKGNLTHVSVDVRQHPEAIPLLKEAGLLPKSDFEKDCEDAIPVTEVFDSVRQTIKTHYANRNSKATGKGKN